MQLLDRIEKRRFVGREFLTWLWFESELFEATLTTAEHGSFGLWLEGSFVLSGGKESTRIKGPQPGAAREAKESVLRGKLPDQAGIHLAWKDRDLDFTLKAETLAVGRLAVPSALDRADETPLLLDDDKKPRTKKPQVDEAEEASLRLAERMDLAAEVEGLLETLYRDFLRLRLGAAWDGFVLAAINAWLRGDDVDAAGYGARRKKALKT